MGRMKRPKSKLLPVPTRASLNILSHFIDVLGFGAMAWTLYFLFRPSTQPAKAP